MHVNMYLHPVLVSLTATQKSWRGPGSVAEARRDAKAKTTIVERRRTPCILAKDIRDFELGIISKVIMNVDEKSLLQNISIYRGDSPN